MAVNIRFEVWTRPESGTFERKFQLKDVQTHNLQIGLSGQGSVTLPADHPRIDDILFVDLTTAGNNVGSMIRAYVEENHLFDFYASRISRNLGSSGSEVAVITGPGPGHALDTTIIYPKDYGYNPSKEPDWVYGPSNSLLSNEGFEGDVTWEDFEDNNPGGWSALSGKDLYGDDYVELVSDPATSQIEAASGSFSLRAQFGNSPSGMSRTLKVIPYSRITINYLFKEPATLGTRYVMFAEAAATYSSNSWLYSGYAFVELDNVARGAGSTDGTFQEFALDIDVGNVSSIVIGMSIVSSTAEPVGYLDYGTFGGDGLGLSPWSSHGEDFTSFVLYAPASPSTSDYVRSGEHSLLYKSDTLPVNSGRSGPRQFVFCEPLVQYNLVGWVYHESGSDEKFRIGFKRFGSSWLAGLTDITVPTHTWTRLQTNGTALQEAYEYTIRWMNRTAAPKASPQWWTDDCSMGVGEDIQTFGYIFNQLLDDAATNHAPDRTALDWLVPTFTDTLDSNGNTWPVEIATSISRGQSMSQVFQSLSSAYDYDGSIRPNDSDDSILELNLYIPLAMGVDHTVTDGNAVTKSGVVSMGPLIRIEPAATELMLEGESQFYGQASAANLTAEWGQLEAWQSVTDFTQNTLSDIAATMLSRVDSETVAVSFQNPNLIPGVHYKLGDYVILALGEDILPAAKYRVVDIVVGGGDPEPTFQVQFASE